jgi:hypothetical protein
VVGYSAAACPQRLTGLFHGAHQVLEAVADAVAQLVMFSVEAEENNSILPDIVPGAQGTVSRTLFLSLRSPPPARVVVIGAR